MRVYSAHDVRSTCNISLQCLRPFYVTPRPRAFLAYTGKSPQTAYLKPGIVVNSCPSAVTQCTSGGGCPAARQTACAPRVAGHRTRDGGSTTKCGRLSPVACAAASAAKRIVTPLRQILRWVNTCANTNIHKINRFLKNTVNG